MSSGVVHARVAKVMLVPLGLYAVASTVSGDVEGGLGVAMGAVAGLLMTPDLDLNNQSHERMRWFKINPLLGHAFYLFWYQDGKMMRHRGVSHIFVIGTLTKVLYIMTPILLAQFIYLTWYDLQLNNLSELYALLIPLKYPVFFWSFVAAWSVQDLMHIIFDIASTWLKRRRLLWYSKV